MITITIRDLCRWDRDGQVPEFAELYSIYRFRDGDFILYVGKTLRNIAERLYEHIGLDGQTQLTKLIEDNLPESLDWQIDLFTVHDCIPLIREHPRPKIINEADIDLAERAMILHSRPAINSMVNSHPAELPEKYVRRRLERIRNTFDSYPPPYPKSK